MRQKRIANMTRAQFLMAVEEAAVSNVVKRYVQDGKVELLGLFFRLKSPLWVVQVLQESESYLYVSQGRGKMVVRWIKEAPSWGSWIGDEVWESPINQGDNPGQYKAYKEQCLRQLQSKFRKPTSE